MTPPVWSSTVPEGGAGVCASAADGELKNVNARSRSGNISFQFNDRTCFLKKTFGGKTHVDQTDATTCLQGFLRFIVPPDFKLREEIAIPGGGSSFLKL